MTVELGWLMPATNRHCHISSGISDQRCDDYCGCDCNCIKSRLSQRGKIFDERKKKPSASHTVVTTIDGSEDCKEKELAMYPLGIG